MRDMLTLDRIRIEWNGTGAPFIVVAAPQADQIRQLLQAASLGFTQLRHDYTEDVMFELAPDTDLDRLQVLLDRSV